MSPKTSRPKTKGDDVRRSRLPLPPEPEAVADGALHREQFNQEQRLRQAVALWLQWNEAYEQVTIEAFEARHDQRKLEAIMDDMDSVRRQAIAASKEALSQSP